MAEPTNLDNYRKTSSTEDPRETGNCADSADSADSPVQELNERQATNELFLELSAWRQRALLAESRLENLERRIDELRVYVKFG